MVTRCQGQGCPPPRASCRTTKFPRDVPPLPWYRSTVPQMLMAGFLPFSAIYIELYYIFASIWGHKVCMAARLLQGTAHGHMRLACFAPSG